MGSVAFFTPQKARTISVKWYLYFANWGIKNATYHPPVGGTSIPTIETTGLEEAPQKFQVPKDRRSHADGQHALGDAGSRTFALPCGCAVGGWWGWPQGGSEQQKALLKTDGLWTFCYIITNSLIQNLTF